MIHIGKRLGLLRRMLALCFRVRPGTTVAIIALLVAEAVAVAGLAYAQGVVVDASPGGLTGQVIVAVALGALFYAASDAGWRIQHSLKYDVADAVELELAQDLLEWTSRSATIEHLEEPEYLDKLTVVLRNSQTLAYAAWALLETLASLGALVVSVVVLAQIHPLLMALALFGLPPIVLAGRAGDLYMQAVDHNSTSLRLENKLHTLGISPEPLKELLVAGSAPVVDQRARGLWRDMTAYEMRARGKAVVLTAIGWAIYVVGVGLALWWTITLVGTGGATVGDVAVVIALAGNLQDQIMGALSSRVRVAEAGRVIDHYLWLEERTSRLLGAGRPAAGDPVRTPAGSGLVPVSGLRRSGTRRGRSGRPGRQRPGRGRRQRGGQEHAGQSADRALHPDLRPGPGRRTRDPARAALAGHGGRVPGLLRVPIPGPGDGRGRGSPADPGPVCGAGRGAKGAGDRARRAARRALGDPARRRLRRGAAVQG